MAITLTPARYSYTRKMEFRKKSFVERTKASVRYSYVSKQFAAAMVAVRAFSITIRY